MAVLSLAGCGSSTNQQAREAVSANTGDEAVTADESKAVETAEGVSVDELVQRITAAYRSVENYYDNARYHETFVERGEGFWRGVMPHQVSVVFARPNRVRITRRIPDVDGGDELKVGVACEGERLRAFISDLPGQILDLPAPEALERQTLQADPELAAALLPVPIENLFPQLDLLLATDESPARFFAGAKVAFLPSQSLDETPCYRLQLRRPSGNYVAWFDKESYLLRKLEIPTEQVRQQTDPDGVLSRLKLWIDFSDARGDTKIASEAFEMEIPEEAELVEKFDPSARKDEAEPIDLTAEVSSKSEEGDSEEEAVEIAAEIMANPIEPDSEEATEDGEADEVKAEDEDSES